MFITTPQPFLAAAVTFPAKTSVVHMGFDDLPRLAETSKNEIEALKHYRCVRDEIPEILKQKKKRWFSIRPDLLRDLSRF